MKGQYVLSTQKTMSLDISSFTDGIYILKVVFNDNQMSTRRFIKY